MTPNLDASVLLRLLSLVLALSVLPSCGQPAKESLDLSAAADLSSTHPADLGVVADGATESDDGGLTSVVDVFPADTGMIDVTTYGAKCDGTTDDTKAIQTALSENIQVGAKRILLFPKGTCIISAPLVWKSAPGANADMSPAVWKSYLTFQGHGQAVTRIKLSDHNPAYQGAATDMIDMGSETPLNSNGGGNDGFSNFILDLTIDAGVGNPGAVALDFMGNNYCGVRNVDIVSTDPGHAGIAGLSMLRYAAGPCLMKNVAIDGFDYGVTVSAFDYGITFENLTITNQKLNGILNTSDILSIRNLVSNNAIPAIVNANANGLITLVGATLAGGLDGSAAIRNSGTLYARNVTTSGYTVALSDAVGTPLTGASITEYVSATTSTLFGGPSSALNLPIEETPEFNDPDLTHWASVVTAGADPTGVADSTAAIQKAIDSGATTVYFPSGTYNVTGTILLRGAVQKIDGFDAKILPSGAAFMNAAAPTPVFKLEAGSAPFVILYRLEIGTYTVSYPGMVHVVQDSTRSLVLVDSNYNGKATIAAYQNTAAGTGSVFVEDMAAGIWQILHPQKFFARQINPENQATKILNTGGTVWILGLKTEQYGTQIETDSGGQTEVNGGFVYPLSGVPIDQSAFIINDSKASFTYAITSYVTPNATAPDGNFKIQVSETQAGVTKQLLTSAVPARGYGSMMALYRSAP